MAASKAQLAFYLTIAGNGDVCPGMGWNHDAVSIPVTMTSHFDQCSKVVINNIGSLQGVWKGENAKYFENCGQSTDVTATFVQYNLFSSEQNMLWYGTQVADSVMHCYHFPDEFKFFGWTGTVWDKSLGKIWNWIFPDSFMQAVTPFELYEQIVYSRIGSYLKLSEDQSFEYSYDLIG